MNHASYSGILFCTISSDLLSVWFLIRNPGPPNTYPMSFFFNCLPSLWQIKPQNNIQSVSNKICSTRSWMWFWGGFLYFEQQGVIVITYWAYIPHIFRLCTFPVAWQEIFIKCSHFQCQVEFEKPLQAPILFRVVFISVLVSVCLRS